MPVRISLLFALTTQPADLGKAIPHSGGWSETLWQDLDFGASVQQRALRLANKRAQLLPASATIIGVRYQTFTLSVNRFLPGGTSTATLQLPGNANWPGDLPQAALLLNAQSTDNQNTRRWALRGMPDQFIINGEYQPTPQFTTKINAYFQELSDDNFYFPGRDLSQPDRRVIAIANTVVTVDNGASFVQGGYLRFHRCIDALKDPVEGSYVITNVNVNAITLGGFAPRTLTQPSGTCRNDVAVMVKITSANFSRAVIKKVGRPFAQYRGRASRRRA